MASECPICFCDFEPSDSFKTYCGHIFHRQCLLQALRFNATCPYCRGDVFFDAFLARFAANLNVSVGILFGGAVVSTERAVDWLPRRWCDHYARASSVAQKAFRLANTGQAAVFLALDALSAKPPHLFYCASCEEFVTSIPLLLTQHQNRCISSRIIVRPTPAQHAAQHRRNSSRQRL